MEKDRELIDRIKRGDLRAFEELYHQYAGFVYNVALGILRNEKDSEEVVQEVFVRLSQKLHQFFFRSSLRTYVYRMAVNQAISLYRKRRRDAEHVDSDYTKGNADPGEDNQELARMVLESLSLEHRLVLTLREIEGLSYEEISQVLRVPVGTVKSRLNRAREEFLKKAKEILRQEGLL